MQLVLEETIAAPLKIVFDVFTEFDRAAERIEGIKTLELLSTGPVGKGTRFRETRVMMGKEATEEMEVTEFDPPHAYAVEAESCGAHFHTRYTFEGGQRETKVTMTTRTKSISFVAKVMSPLMGLMMGPAMKKAMRKDHADLKAACEALAASGEGAA